MIITPSRHFDGSDFSSFALLGLDFRGIVEDIVGSVLWISEAEGFCTCPGSHLHTTGAAKKDCKLYLAPVPTISCLHASCRVVVEEMTKELRLIARTMNGGAKRRATRLTPEEKEHIARVRARESLRRQAASSRHRLLREFQWPYESIRKSSGPLAEDPSTHWRHVIGMFAGDEAIWVGALYQSGDADHSDRFRLQAGWLASEPVPGHFTCPSTFKVGSFSRSKENIVRRQFLVVESDELDKDSIGAVFRWLRNKVGLSLRCIVDTAGKSLHGWFDFPPEAELDDLKIILPELGCDPKMFTATQPCRLPGALRNGRYQRLVYVKGEGVTHE